MVWVLLIAGVVLVVAGVWRGTGGRAVSDRAEPVARTDLSRAEAWDILTRPMAVEVEAPLGPRARRSSTVPGRERRFLRGLLVGIGSGLLVTALIMLALPIPVRVRPPRLADGEATPPGSIVGTPIPDVSVPKPLTRTFVVEDGEAAPTIAAKLRDAGLIMDEAAFIRRVADRRLDTRLKAGTFIISTGASLDEVIDSLTA